MLTVYRSQSGLLLELVALVRGLLLQHLEGIQLEGPFFAAQSLEFFGDDVVALRHYGVEFGLQGASLGDFLRDEL